MKPRVLIFLALLGLWSQGGAAPASHAPLKDNAWCLRCHGMATLATRDPATGLPVNLSVDRDAFAHSNHGKLDCLGCHDVSSARYPHGPRLASERLACLKCHQDDPKFEKRRFPEIEKEFEESVHKVKLGDSYTCFACHDPHSFKVTDYEKLDSLAKPVLKDNRICLSCHAEPDRFASLTKRAFPALEARHGWLPNQALHFEKVRCVDCHSSYAPPNLLHKILPASQAVRDCVKCHSQNTILMTQLYKYRAQPTGTSKGFLNAALMNDAYVIGATRNLWMDRLSLLLFGLAFLGILVHGLLRWRSFRRKGGRP